MRVLTDFLLNAFHLKKNRNDRKESSFKIWKILSWNNFRSYNSFYAVFINVALKNIMEKIKEFMDNT